jgi:hypothetical protein
MSGALRLEEKTIPPRSEAMADRVVIYGKDN